MTERIIMVLRDPSDHCLEVVIDVLDNCLAPRWLAALRELVQGSYHLEKNYCWLGFAGSRRDPDLLCELINRSIQAINESGLAYHIQDHFTVHNTVGQQWRLDRQRMNSLHRYFEDLQGHAGAISQHYQQADAATRWHIRQLNLLCHEYESLMLSIRKAHTAPEWQRPSQLMCWLNAPRFELEPQHYGLFGIDTINRAQGGVYLGVNKAVGKHHWEVFTDEGRDSRISELTTSALRPQTLACGDFDIEWARDPGAFPWQQQQLRDFRAWLEHNGFDPNDPSLTIGHPQVAQVDLRASFGTQDYQEIWNLLAQHDDVLEISMPGARARYPYRWNDHDYQQQQIYILQEK